MIRIPHGCDPGRTYLVSIPDRISRPFKVDEEHCDEEHREETAVALELVPAARLEGTLKAAVGHRLPESGDAVARTCATSARKSPVVVGRIPLRIDDEGRWSVPVPAGCLDASLEAPLLAAVTWPGLTVEAGEALDLGAVALEPGAAILAQVQAAETGRPLPGARVEVVPAAELTRVATALVTGRDVALAQGKITGERGWARLAGLAPGRVYLRVTAPDRAPTLTPPIDLEPGVEWVSDPVTLGLPASLEVMVLGGAEDMGEDLEMHVALTPELVCGVAPPTQLSESVEPGGVADFTGLLPGTWSLGIQLVKESGLSRTVMQRHLELESGDSAFEVVELEDNLYSGIVTYLGDPVRAELGFDREHEDGFFSRARAKSGTDGNFKVHLPGPGEYTVHVTDLDGGLPGTVKVPGISFRDPGETVRIELPEGRLQGVVVDTDGLPVAEASVSAFRLDERAKGESEKRQPIYLGGVRSDSRGEFAFEAVSPGRWHLEARHGKLRSRPVSEELEEDEEVTGIRLRLTGGRKVSGRISTGSHRPVAGAHGAVELPPKSVQVFGDREAFTTDDAGRFEVTVHDAVGAPANIAVCPRHLPVTVFTAPVAEGLELEISQLGGALEVVVPAGDGVWSAGDLSHFFLMADRGGAVQLVQAAAPRNGGMIVNEPEVHRLSVPSLAPGGWRLVHIADTRAMVNLLRGRSTGTVVAHFISRPGAVSRLELPAP